MSRPHAGCPGGGEKGVNGFRPPGLAGWAQACQNHLRNVSQRGLPWAGPRGEGCWEHRAESDPGQPSGSSWWGQEHRQIVSLSVIRAVMGRKPRGGRGLAWAQRRLPGGGEKWPGTREMKRHRRDSPGREGEGPSEPGAVTGRRGSVTDGTQTLS